MKKAYLVTFVVTTRVIAEEQDEDKLIDDLSVKARAKILKDPTNYLMGDNLEYDLDEEIPYGDDPEDDNGPSVNDKIKTALSEAGFADRLGKNYYSCPHQCGLPKSSAIMVKPDSSPIDGAHAVIVTATHVSSYVCAIPYNHNNWMLRYSKEYKNQTEMIAAVDQLTRDSQGCW